MPQRPFDNRLRCATNLRRCQGLSDIRIRRREPLSGSHQSLEQLDLLISIDSGVANLAGAIGRPVWVCLYPTSDWRWLLECSTTPWYPIARIFQQPRIGD